MLEVAIVFYEVVVFSELARLEYGKELDCVEIEDCTASTVVNSAAKAETEFTNRNANANIIKTNFLKEFFITMFLSNNSIYLKL